MAERNRFPPRDRGDQGELTQRPFRGPLKNVRPGPECLKCSRNIDTRTGWSLPEGRGSRRVQRQGYLCTECLEQAEQDLEARWMAVWKESTVDGQPPVVNGFPVKMGIEVPVYSDEELEGMLSG